MGPTHCAIRLQLGNFDTPWILEGATKIRVATWSPTQPLRGVELLWRFAKWSAAVGNSGPSQPVTNPVNDVPPPARHRTSSKQNHRIYWANQTRLRNLTQLPGNFDKLTPMAKTEALNRPGAPQHMVNEFMDSGARLNILPAHGPIRSVAPGIHNYARFCAMADSAAFPPSTGAIRRRRRNFQRRGNIRPLF